MYADFGLTLFLLLSLELSCSTVQVMASTEETSQSDDIRQGDQCGEQQIYYTNFQYIIATQYYFLCECKFNPFLLNMVYIKWDTIIL